MAPHMMIFIHNTLKQGFSTSARLMFWGQIILCCEFWPIRCRVFSSLPNIYSIDCTGTPPRWDNRKCLQTLPDVSWGTNSCTTHPTLFENHSSTGTASSLSLGKGSEAWWATAESPHREGGLRDNYPMSRS